MSKSSLADVSLLITKGTTPTSIGGRFTDSGINFIKSESIADSKYLNKEIFGHIDEDTDLKLKRSRLAEGDLLFSIAGAYLGKIGIVRAEDLPANTNQAVGIVRLDKNLVNVDYIYYYFSQPHINKYINKLSSQSSQPNLNLDLLGKLEFDLKDISTQQKIAAVLSALDAKIELNARINAELESMAKTLYDYWFVQFAPLSFGHPPKYDMETLGNTESQPVVFGGTEGGRKMVWNEELKREIPLGWEVCELRKYVTSKRGISYSGKDIVGDGVPMINLNSFTMGTGTYKPEGIKTYSGDYGENKILKPFDLVMCNTQQTALDPKKDIIGKSFLVPDIFNSDIVSSHHVTTITVEKESLKYYLNSLFNTDYFHRYISGYATGTNILGLNFEGVLSFKTAIPNDDLLERYKAIVLNVEKQKARIIKESQTLTELRGWLLPMLMNGQVKVG
jgi:type I restriction enzyme S subunit